MHQAVLFPPRFRIFSGSGLKALALLAMLVDHSAILFAPLLGRELFVLFGLRFTPYLLLRGFGRIAFPIFCFLLAEGYRHTRSRSRYALSLLLFSLLSELPYNLFNAGTLHYAHQNVFFTLLLGFLAIWALDRFREQPFWAALCVLGLLAASYFLHADYGWKGFCFLVLTYVAAEYPAAQALAGLSLLPWPVGVALSYLPLNLYNGKRGFIRSPWLKYGCYAFYPVHLLLLWLLRVYVFGQG